MWKKPVLKTPDFKNLVCEELNELEALEINGEAAGTCWGVGYACDTRKGGIRVGTCAIVGYACNWREGN
jgi:hypothetical protein